MMIIMMAIMAQNTEIKKNSKKEQKEKLIEKI